MTDLYKEALAEAKKLRELAELDAKNSIIEAIAPHIKNIISKETALLSKDFIFEQIDNMSLDDSEEPSPLADTSSDIVGPPETAAVSAPIEPTGTDIVNVPLPDEEGKIVVDFEQLFVEPGATNEVIPPVDTSEIKPGEEIPVTTPGAQSTDVALSPGEEEVMPVSPTGENENEEENIPPVMAEKISLKGFKTGLAEVAMKIDSAYYGGRISDIVQESLKNKLFYLLEQLEQLVEKAEITTKQGKLNEQRLEFLFLKLKEASLQNSYTKEFNKNNSNQKEKDNMTKSLKEYAAKLFETEDQESLAQDSESSGKTGLPVDNEMTDHAKDVSGVSPEVDDLFKEEAGQTVDTDEGAAGSVDEPAPEGTRDDMEEKPWQEGEPLAEEVSEEVEAEGSAGFGDTSEKPVASQEMVFEVDEEELKEAIRAIRKENIMRKVKALKKEAKEVVPGKSAKVGWEKGKPAGGDDASKKAALKKEVKSVVKRTVKEQVMEDPDVDGMDEDLVLNVDLPDDIEDQLDLSDLDVDIDLEEPEEEEEELGDEEGELELGGDEEEGELELGGEPEMDSGEDRMLLHDTEDEEEELEDEGAMEELRMENRKLRRSFLEARKSAKAHISESRKLKEEMTETNLFLAKLLYLNKFLQLEGLSRKQKQQIVVHLDKATTVSEAKVIYNKLRNKLDESLKTSRKPMMVGSASKPTSTGSARGLNENRSMEAVDHGDELDPVVGSFERWQRLANIANNNNKESK